MKDKLNIELLYDPYDPKVNPRTKKTKKFSENYRITIEREDGIGITEIEVKALFEILLK